MTIINFKAHEFWFGKIWTHRLLVWHLKLGTVKRDDENLNNMIYNCEPLKNSLRLLAKIIANFGPQF